MIVVEFAEHGNLLRHLRDRRKQNYDDMNEYSLDISSVERVRIASDVADGMKHLASMKVRQRCCLEKKFFDHSLVRSSSSFRMQARSTYKSLVTGVYHSVTRRAFRAKLSEREEKTWGIGILGFESNLVIKKHVQWWIHEFSRGRGGWYLGVVESIGHVSKMFQFKNWNLIYNCYTTKTSNTTK